MLSLFQKTIAAVLAFLLVLPAVLVPVGMSADTAEEFLKEKIQPNNVDPVTDFKEVEVKKGDVVRYTISLKAPRTIHAWRIWLYYDSGILKPDSSFGSGGIAANSGVAFALGEKTDAAKAVDEHTQYNFPQNNMVTVQCENIEGYADYVQGQALLVVQFTAQQTGTTVIKHWFGEAVSILNMNNREFEDYADPSGSGEMINGAKQSCRAEVFSDSQPPATTENTTVPLQRIGVFGDVNGDEKVDVSDVLIISKHIAKLIVLSDNMVLLGDVDLNNEVQLEDMLRVQRYIARFPASPVGEEPHF